MRTERITDGFDDSSRSELTGEMVLLSPDTIALR